MAFTVDTFQVAQYGGVLGNHHGDAKAAEGFAEANLQIGAQPGLIAELVGSHEQAKGEIVKALTGLASVCEASSAELDRVRQMYDRVDQGSAERLDRTYPDPGSPPRMPSVPGLPADTSTQAVRQITHPAERLKPPQAAEFTNPVQLVNDLGNLISAGYWTQQFLDATIQVNPVEEFSNWVAGDWEQFAKASDALNSLSLFCGDLAYDLKTNVTTLLTSWTGNAANEAFQYFNGLAGTVDGYAAGPGTLRDKYREAAQGVWEFSETINDVIQDIFDSIFWGAVELAAGGVLAETVVGPAVLWSLAALECKNVVDGWKQMTNLLMNVQNTIRLIHGGVLDVIGSGGNFGAHPLPAGYDHPGA
ncbi:hypothetical protein [Amycolatopsis sp. MEPSY49]|uniref:hypothetical protein n=1 Tax=Amycolatopsis sp. MEPSY49 TaxID=3151600 RepID=UPI003EFB31AA